MYTFSCNRIRSHRKLICGYPKFARSFWHTAKWLSAVIIVLFATWPLMAFHILFVPSAVSGNFSVFSRVSRHEDGSPYVPISATEQDTVPCTRTGTRLPRGPRTLVTLASRKSSAVQSVGLRLQDTSCAVSDYQMHRRLLRFHIYPRSQCIV